jgi:hypothetical protein
LWNDPYLNDPVHNIHDLCEMDVDLNVVASDLCSGTNVTANYLLFLDLNHDGIMETQINGNQPSATPGTIQANNANGVGTTVQFDTRNVPTADRYRFAIQNSVVNGKKTARVAFNTIAGSNTFVNAELPHGTHKIKWIVTDGCGNEAVCEYTFIIRDKKAPTIVCLNGVAINIMPTGMIDIWDTDMYQYTVDNCTPTNQLKTAICTTCTTFPVDAAGNPIKAVLFNCTQLGTQTVRIWSQDQSGNADYCETYLLVQDNAGNCNINNKSVAGAAKGTDKNGNIQGASDVLVALNIAATNSTPAINTTINTDLTGVYNFLNAVPVAASLTVTPNKDMDHQNGVDMLDVLKVQRHILGLEPLASPYRQIAGDVNNTRSITGSDIVELRKLILGSYTKFPAVASWRFVDQAYQFPVQSNAFSAVFPEMITVANVQASKDDANFEAIKSGDVTGNAVFNSAMSSDDRTTATIYLDAADQTVVAGQEVSIQLTANTAVDAAQFTVLFDGLTFTGTDLENGNYAVHSGAITVATEQAGQFTLTARATKAGKLSQMVRISDKITQAVAFSSTERLDVAFRFSGVVIGAGFELLQNIPNPVKNTTQIGFVLPSSSTGTLTFTNAAGVVIKVVKQDFQKGLNTIEISQNELESGVIFYQLDTPEWSDVKKMVVIK